MSTTRAIPTAIPELDYGEPPRDKEPRRSRSRSLRSVASLVRPVLRRFQGFSDIAYRYSASRTRSPRLTSPTHPPPHPAGPPSRPCVARRRTHYLPIPKKLPLQAMRARMQICTPAIDARRTYPTAASPYLALSASASIWRDLRNEGLLKRGATSKCV